MEFVTEYGSISYSYQKDPSYPHGLLIFMGSYIYKSFRRQGKFSFMVDSLFSQFEEGTEVHVPLSNKKLITMFKRLGFERVSRIEYWGECANSIKMKGFIK